MSPPRVPCVLTRVAWACIDLHVIMECNRGGAVLPPVPLRVALVARA